MAQAQINHDNAIRVSRRVRLRPQIGIRDQTSRKHIFQAASEIFEVLKNMQEKLSEEGGLYAREMFTKIECACEFKNMCMRG